MIVSNHQFRRACLGLALLAAAVPFVMGTPVRADADPVIPSVSSALERARSETDAMAQARESGRPVAVEQLTTADTTVVANPTGSYTAEVAAEPQRMETATGWETVDTGLVPSGEALAPLASPTDVTVSNGGTQPLVVLRDGAHALALRWPSPLPEPVISDGAAVYRIGEGIDLVVRASTTGFSFDVVVADERAAADPLLQNLRFVWTGVGVSLVATDEGFEARNESGAVVFQGPRPRAWDSATAGLVATAADAVSAADASQSRPSVDLGLTVGPSDLVLSTPRGWLTDPDRVFPVVIDPSADRYADDWAMVWSDGQRFWNKTSEDHRVGYDGWQDGKKSRLFYAMRLDGLAGKHILKATFAHSQYHSPNFTCRLGAYGPGVELWRTGPISSSTRWSNQPSWRNKLAVAKLAHGNARTCPGDSQTEWGGADLRASVQAASSARESRITFGLRSADESDRNGWRRFQRKNARGHVLPKLVVEYNTVPGTPTGLAVQYARSWGGRLYVPDRTPLVSAVVTDQDAGQHLKSRFSTTVARVARTFTSGSVSSRSRASTQWPSVPDGTYATSARSWDGIDWSPRSTSLTFTVDTAAPAPPVVVRSSASTPVGRRVGLTIDSASTDVIGYLWGVGTATPTTWIPLTPATLGAVRSATFVVPRSGPNIVSARAVDRAGNLSPITQTTVTGLVVLPWDSYRLDGDGADARDASVAGDDAPHPLVVPEGTAWTSGRAQTPQNRALDLRAASPVRGLASSSTGVASTNSLSLSAWIMPSSITAAPTARFQSAVGLSDGSSTAAAVGVYQSANALSGRAALLLDAATGAGSRTMVVAVDNLPVDRWVHVAGVYNRETGTAQLYIDGELRGSTAKVPVPFLATQVVIGDAPENGTPQAFTGVVDDVGIFKGPADAAAVRQARDAWKTR